MTGGAAPDAPGMAAGDVLQRRLTEQVAELRRRERLARSGDAESVHRARVACSRLRSALLTHGELVDAQVTVPVRLELGWLRGLLGEVRDAQVAHGRLRRLVEAQPATPETGAVLRRLDAAYDARGRAASAALAAALNGERHRDLDAVLVRLAEEPPWTPVAALPAREVLPAQVRRAWRRLEQRMRAVGAAADRDRALHQARREAKRLRYAAETLAPAWGEDARRLVAATTALTDVLGDRQDTVVSRRDLVVLADAATAAREDPSTWLLLEAREAEHAAELDRELPDVWAQLSRKRLRRWLR